MNRFKPINLHDEETLKMWRRQKTKRGPKCLPPHRILLNALEMGLCLQLDGMDILMAKDDFEDTDPLAIGRLVTITKGEEEPTVGFCATPDITISFLNKAGQAMTEEELFSIAASTTLRKMANERIQKREASLKKQKVQ